METEPFFVAVTLYVVQGQEEAFEVYELSALARLHGHTGRVQARVRCAGRATGNAAPYEFHLLSFASKEAFTSFVASGVPFQDERERVIAKTTILTGAPVSLPKDR